MVPAKISSQLAAPLQELNNLTDQIPQLSAAAAFYGEALPLLIQHRKSIEPLSLDPVVVQHKLEAGLALLVNEELPLDTAATSKLFLNLCKIVESGFEKDPPVNGDRAKHFMQRSIDHFPLLKRTQPGTESSADSARQIRRKVERNELDLGSVWAMLSGGDLTTLAATADGMALDPELLRTLAWFSLQPAFQAWAQELQATSDFEGWRHGSCPVCGSRPSISETQGKEGARRLRCGLCGASWRYSHLQCVFCQNKNYRLLRYFNVEGEGDRYRVQACTVCLGYIKMIKTFDPIPVVMLPVQDLATLHLDLIAAERGYQRVTAS